MAGIQAGVSFVNTYFPIVQAVVMNGIQVAAAYVMNGIQVAAAYAMERYLEILAAIGVILLCHKAAKHYTMDSNQNTQEKAIDIHNQMVKYLDGHMITDEKVSFVMLFSDNPLPHAELYNINTINDLFEKLMKYETISVGNYTRCISQLELIHPQLATHVKKKEGEMQEIINGGKEQKEMIAKMTFEERKKKIAELEIEIEERKKMIEELEIENPQKDNMLNFFVAAAAAASAVAFAAAFVAVAASVPHTEVRFVIGIGCGATTVFCLAVFIAREALIARRKYNMLNFFVVAAAAAAAVAFAAAFVPVAASVPHTEVRFVIGIGCGATTVFCLAVFIAGKALIARRKYKLVDFFAMFVIIVGTATCTWPDASFVIGFTAGAASGTASGVIAALITRKNLSAEMSKAQDDDTGSTSVEREQVSFGNWNLKDMYDACESGDKEKCFAIHEKFPALLTQNSRECLIRIAESGNKDCFIAVESVLHEGKGEEERQQCIANIVDADKESMLHKACRSGNRDMFLYLCTTCPSLVASTDKYSLLHVACKLNKADILSELLHCLEDVNEIGKCLTQCPLDDHCKQAVALELKQRLADKVKSQGSYRIEPTCNSEGEVVFLAYGLNVVRERVEQFVGLEVLFRNPKQVNDEAIHIANSEEMGSLNTSKIRGMNYAEKAIKMHGTRLMQSHSNINALGVSHLKSRKGGKDLKLAENALVVIYCSSKGYRPIKENKFPPNLFVGSIAVLIDVREGFFELAPRTYSAIPSAHYHSKLKMGCACEVEDDGERRCGTIGPFVKIHSTKDGVLDGFLTCAHVAYGFEDGEDSYSYNEINTPTKLQVNQPAVDSFSMPPPIIRFDPKCGKTYRGAFGVNVDDVTVDAAVVAVQNDRMPSGGEFAVLDPNQLGQIGFTVGAFPVFDSAEQEDPTAIKDEDEIVKFGAKTHATKGVYIAPVHVRELIKLGITGPTGLIERRFVMRGQLEISNCTANEHLFDLGDSGSGVFVKRGNDLRCLGLGIGCLSNGSAVVTPIKPILKALGVELMSFSEPMDDT